MTERKLGPVGWLLVVALLAIVVFGLQVSSDVYAGGFSRYQSDEPANYVTGLMAYDYVTSALFESPMEFASDFYLHYPAVAIGHWPPMLYVVQAAVYVFTGPSLEASLVLNGCLAVLAGLFFFLSLRMPLGFGPALAAAVVLVATGDMQQMAAHVMAEPLMTALGLLAVFYLCRFVQHENSRDLLFFGLLAGLAVLTKALAWSLVPLPLVTAVATRRFEWFRKPAFWGTHALILALALPWEIGMSKAVSAGFVETGPAVWPSRLTEMAALLELRLGWPILVVGSATALAIVGGAWRGDYRLVYFAPFAVFPWLVCGLLLVAPVPVSSRYLILAAPAFLALVAAALHYFSHKVLGGARAAAVTAFGLVLLFVPWMSVLPKASAGFEPLARRLLSDEYAKHTVSLVSSQSGGELLVVAEAARIENPPRRHILRASKLLARTSWMTEGPYDPHVATVAETSERVLIPRASLILLHEDRPYRELQHHQLLRQMVQSNPDQWRFRETIPVRGVDENRPGAVEIYELADFEQYPQGPIQIDMTYTLGRKLRLDPRAE